MLAVLILFLGYDSAKLNPCLASSSWTAVYHAQVLVYHDLLGMMSHPHHAKVTPKFCKSYAQVGKDIQVRAWFRTGAGALHVFMRVFKADLKRACVKMTTLCLWWRALKSDWHLSHKLRHIRKCLY